MKEKTAVLRRLGNIFTLVYAAVQKLEKDSWKELQFSLVDNFKLNVDFQDSLDDEKDSRSSQEYMNDLEEEYKARTLLAKSKRFFKNGTQRFSSAKATDQTKCHKCGKKGHFAKDCWSKISVPSYQSPFQPKLLHLSEHKPEPRHTKDFKAKYDKVKAKPALLSSNASAPSPSSSKNKGLIAESYDWDEEEVSSDDNDVTEVKALMALADEERVSAGKESARNGEWIKISMKKCINEQIPTQKKKILGIDQLTEDTSSSGLKDPVFVKSSADNSEISITGSNIPKLFEDEDSTLSNHDTGKHPLPSLEKLTVNEPVYGPKTIKSILKLKSTFKAETLKEDDPPLPIVMKELNELRLQISKNKSSYFKNKNSQQCKRTNHRTCDHAEFMSSMNINLYHTSQGESSSRSRPARPAIPFLPAYIVDIMIINLMIVIISLRRGIKPRNPQHIIKNCETCGSNVHTTYDHNDIEWFRKREALQAKNVESFKASKTGSSSALRSKSLTKSTKIKQSERGISINKERYINELPRMYDKIGSSMNTPIMPSNMLGPDLNSKAVSDACFADFHLIQSLANMLKTNPKTSYKIHYFHSAVINSSKEKVSFNLEDILLYTNNEVALLYPEHNNKDYFKCVSDFISKCCLRKPFTRSLNMYKEYLAEFWYSTIDLENSKVSFSILTGGIYGEVGVNTFRNAIGAHYLPHSSEYVTPPSIDVVRQWFPTIGYGEEVSSKGTLRKSLLPPSLANGININYANIFWEDIIIKLKKKQREKVVPYTRFLSLLIMHKMKEEYRDGEVNLYPTQVFSVNNWALNPNQPEEPPFTTHVLAICSADKPVVFKAPKPSSNTERVPQGRKPRVKPGHKKHSTSSKQPSVFSKEATKGVTSKARANPQLSSNKTKSVSDGLETVITTPETGTSNVAKTSEEIKFGAIKLEDLAKLVPNVKVYSKDLESPEDDPIIVSLTAEFSKILSAHDFSNSLPTELKDLLSKFNELTKEVKGLKQEVHELELELPGDLKDIPSKLEDFTKIVTSLTSQVAELKTLQWELPAEFLSLPVQVASVQAKLKTVDALLGLLLNVTKDLNKFAQVFDSASSKARDQGVPLAGQADTMPAEGEKNTNQATIS
ncbi:retrovirus-related pol polyprotein from transposon TNT 1-94 [Tanacetum coccineum]